MDAACQFLLVHQLRNQLSCRVKSLRSSLLESPLMKPRHCPLFSRVDSLLVNLRLFLPINLLVSLPYNRRRGPRINHLVNRATYPPLNPVDSLPANPVVSLLVIPVHTRLAFRQLLPAVSQAYTLPVSQARVRLSTLLACRVANRQSRLHPSQEGSLLEFPVHSRQ
jgi:hypothetical protein